MRSHCLVLVRSCRSRYCQDAATAKTGLFSGSAVVSNPRFTVSSRTQTIRKSFSSYGRRLSSQQPKAFTRYTLPKSIRIEPASDMTAGSTSRARTAYVALGSNLGDRIAHIEQACREMEARGIRVKRTSSLWETEPMYYADQDRFVNGACEVGAFFFFFFFFGLRVDPTCPRPIDLHASGRNHTGAS